MAPRLVEHLTRRTLPRALAQSAQVTLPARVGAATRRRAGRAGRMELYFAFDDPCSAAAVPDLLARNRSRRVQIRLMPVVRRGMAEDPAVELKRRYAIVDARKLAAAQGLELSRSEPPSASATAFLANWVAASRPSPALTAFSCAALAELWFGSDGDIEPARYEDLWRERLHRSPPPVLVAESEQVRACEARMARRGMYETPAAWAHGRWYFAHDRPVQIGEWLDQLGWGLPARMAARP